MSARGIGHETDDDPDSMLADARLMDLGLLKRLERERRRRQRGWARDVLGPTANWQRHVEIGAVPALSAFDEPEERSA